MKQISFLEVGMENYGLYIEPMVLSIKEATITLVVGPNGVGKSMMLEAIPFTFYGVTPRGARGDDVVNQVVGKNCRTWVKFNVNYDSYIVTRYHKHSKLGNTVIVNKNGDDIKRGHREVLPFIENLVCSQRTFTNTLMFGQKVKDFFTDLTDSEKKEIFRKILGLERYVVYYKQADVMLKERQNEVSQINNDCSVQQTLLDSTLKQIQYFQDEKEKFYENKESKIKHISEQIQSKKDLLSKCYVEISQLEESESKIGNVEEEIHKLRSDIVVLNQKKESDFQNLQQQKEKKILELNNEATGEKQKVQLQLSNSISELQNQHLLLEQERSSVTKEYNELSHKVSIEIQKLQGLVESKKERCQEINQNVIEANTSICPTCQQEVTESTKKMLLEKISGYEEEIQDLQESINKLEDQNKRMRQEEEEKKDDIEKRTIKLTNEISKLEHDQRNKIQLLEQRLQEKKTKIEEIFLSHKNELEQDYEKEIKNLKSKLEELQKQQGNIEKLQQDLEAKRSLTEKTATEIQFLEKRLEEVEKETFNEEELTRLKEEAEKIKSVISELNTRKETTDRDISILGFWKSAFSPSGIPSMLIDEAIPFINTRVSEYLDVLTNGRFIVSFDTLAETKAGEFRDKIAVRVVDTHTRANSRLQLSGGQTRIIDIATMLTLSDLQSMINNVSFNVMMFDEIFDSLDGDNIGYVCRVLQQIKQGRAIFVISHQHQDQLDADEILNLA